MTTTPKHTALPWFHRGGRITAGERWIATTRPFVIQSKASDLEANQARLEEDVGNAAFIELAVNNHERLLEAAKAMVRDCKNTPECHSLSCLGLRAAIAAVEGRTG